MSVSKFMMNFCKIGLMFLFLLCTLLCVSFANSENLRPVETIVTYGVAREASESACQLKVEFNGAVVRYQPLGYSKTVFTGIWPSDSGEVELSSSHENLKIQFHKDNMGIHPVSYIYTDLSPKNSRLTEPKVCFGIQ